MTWKSVLEPGLSGQSYVANVSKRWHLLPAEGWTAENDGVLMDVRMGHVALQQLTDSSSHCCSCSSFDKQL